MTRFHQALKVIYKLKRSLHVDSQSNFARLHFERVKADGANPIAEVEEPIFGELDPSTHDHTETQPYPLEW